jgi:lipopolysaccharide export system permease protein
MKILTRYVIKAHLGPFIFAFVAVTGLLFLNAVAARLENLVGRGLEWEDIRTFMILSLPHVVALTFPMSILVAVLYASSDMTEHNEIAAMAGGGIHPSRIMVPLVGAGLLLTAIMFYFNDRVLPEANHRLSSLLYEVASKSPTLELRESVMNPIISAVEETKYFLRARSIDSGSNHLEDIDIYDLSLPGETRTIVAKEGDMAFTDDGHDLYLTLREGTVYLVSDAQPGDFQHMNFDTQILPIRGVGAEMRRGEGTDVRSDREMSIAMLQDEVNTYQSRLDTLIARSYELSLRVVETSLGSALSAAANGADGVPSSDPAEVVEAAANPSPLPTISPDGVLQFPLPGYLPVRDELVENAAKEYRSNHAQWEIFREQVAGHQVEIYKKHAIAFACLIFVLLAPPLALRYPRGGVGMVIASSLGIFFLYWMGLIGGERLADHGRLHPLIAMWAPNFILLVPALFLLSGMGKQMASNRGGTWDEVSFRIGEAMRRLYGGSAGRAVASRSGGDG